MYGQKKPVKRTNCPFRWQKNRHRPMIGKGEENSTVIKHGLFLGLMLQYLVTLIIVIMVRGRLAVCVSV